MPKILIKFEVVLVNINIFDFTILHRYVHSISMNVVLNPYYVKDVPKTYRFTKKMSKNENLD